jgi:hypothetical protein
LDCREPQQLADFYRRLLLEPAGHPVCLTSFTPDTVE